MSDAVRSTTVSPPTVPTTGAPATPSRPVPADLTGAVARGDWSAARTTLEGLERRATARTLTPADVREWLPALSAATQGASDRNFGEALLHILEMLLHYVSAGAYSTDRMQVEDLAQTLRARFPAPVRDTFTGPGTPTTPVAPGFVPSANMPLPPSTVAHVPNADLDRRMAAADLLATNGQTEQAVSELRDLGALATRLGDSATASRAYTRAADILREAALARPAGEHAERGRTLDRARELLVLGGNHAAAIEVAGLAATEFTAGHLGLEAARQQRNVAESLTALGRTSEATAAYRRAGDALFAVYNDSRASDSHRAHAGSEAALAYQAAGLGRVTDEATGDIHRTWFSVEGTRILLDQTRGTPPVDDSGSPPGNSLRRLRVLDSITDPVTTGLSSYSPRGVVPTRTSPFFIQLADRQAAMGDHLGAALLLERARPGMRSFEDAGSHFSPTDAPFLALDRSIAASAEVERAAAAGTPLPETDHRVHLAHACTAGRAAYVAPETTTRDGNLVLTRPTAGMTAATEYRAALTAADAPTDAALRASIGAQAGSVVAAEMARVTQDSSLGPSQRALYFAEMAQRLPTGSDLQRRALALEGLALAQAAGEAARVAQGQTDPQQRRAAFTYAFGLLSRATALCRDNASTLDDASATQFQDGLRQAVSTLEAAGAGQTPGVRSELFLQAATLSSAAAQTYPRDSAEHTGAPSDDERAARRAFTESSRLAEAAAREPDGDHAWRGRAFALAGESLLRSGSGAELTRRARGFFREAAGEFEQASLDAPPGLETPSRIAEYQAAMLGEAQAARARVLTGNATVDRALRPPMDSDRDNSLQTQGDAVRELYTMMAPPSLPGPNGPGGRVTTAQIRGFELAFLALPTSGVTLTNGQLPMTETALRAASAAFAARAPRLAPTMTRLSTQLATIETNLAAAEADPTRTAEATRLRSDRTRIRTALQHATDTQDAFASAARRYEVLGQMATAGVTNLTNPPSEQNLRDFGRLTAETELRRTPRPTDAQLLETLGARLADVTQAFYAHHGHVGADPSYQRDFPNTSQGADRRGRDLVDCEVMSYDVARPFLQGGLAAHGPAPETRSLGERGFRLNSVAREVAPERGEGHVVLGVFPASGSPLLVMSNGAALTPSRSPDPLEAAFNDVGLGRRAEPTATDHRYILPGDPQARTGETVDPAFTHPTP